MLSGVQRVCLDELLRLDQSKFERYLICKEAGKLSIEASAAGVKCIFIPELQREINPFMDIIALFKLYMIIKKYNFDIVHTHSSKPGVLGRIAARLNNVKLVVHTVHGFSFPSAKNNFQYLIFWAMEKIGAICGDLLICLHEDDANIARNNLHIDNGKIKIIKNGVDTNKFYKKSNSSKADELRILYDINESRDVVVGMVGRLWPQKNPLMLLHAAKNIMIEYPNVKFLFVGDGELKEPMLEFIAQHKLHENVKICGWCSDVSPYHNIFDIFVLPSLWEGMPLAILEAESSSLPCIVSDIQGNRNIVRHAVDGYVFSLNDCTKLEIFIKQLISDEELRVSMGNNARDKIISHYKIEDRILALQDLYLAYKYNS